jgi:hypothetical protein
MKKLLTVLVLLSSVSATASLVTFDNKLMTQCRGVGYENDAFCVMRVTTSSQVLFLVDGEARIPNEQKMMAVLAGVGANDFSAAQAIADDEGVSVDEVIEAAENSYNAK